MIAQEFAEVFPDYVKSSGEQLANSDEEILQVDPFPLTIYSAAGIQELHQIVQEKEVKIVALQARVTALEDSVCKISPSTRASSFGMAVPGLGMIGLLGLMTICRRGRGAAR